MCNDCKHHKDKKSKSCKCKASKCNEKEKKFTVIEHDFYKTVYSTGSYSPCEGENTQTFNYEQGYFNNSLYDKYENEKIGFSLGHFSLTGNSDELVNGLEKSLGSGADIVYLNDVQFVFNHCDDNPYNSEDSISVRGPLYYDYGFNEGEIAVPTKWSIIGGTGKYKKAHGEVHVTELGCSDIAEGKIGKYEYKFHVYY